MKKEDVTPIIPKRLLFGNPVKMKPAFSPDGKQIAYLSPVNNVLNIWVCSPEGNNYRPITYETDRGIKSFFWAFDNRNILFVQDIQGNENYRLFSVNTETGVVTRRTPYDNCQVQIVGLNHKFPNELLISLNKENQNKHDVYRLHLDTNEIELEVVNPGDVTNWLVDYDFQVRGAVRILKQGGSELLIRDSEQSDWRTIVTWNSDDSSSSRPVSFSRDGSSIYLIDARDVNAGRLIRLHLSTGEIEIIAEDEIYDVEGVLSHPTTFEIEAVLFTKAKREWMMINGSIQDDIERLSQNHPGELFFESRDQADENWIVGFRRDVGSTPFYTYNRLKKQAKFLFHSNPELEKFKLSSMEPFSFESRDGLTIHGYITQPFGLTGPQPMVLYVHGGPWTRDFWGYNPQTQWLVNRGYVCLQVNFRGSTGYGKNFVNAGDREWGSRMHNDLIDAVQWAIQHGYADPDRVAILGASYGGYAALVGATFTPDVFCCAVDIVGPSNLLTLINLIPPYWSPMLSRLYKRVGNPNLDEDFLKSRSPLYKVDQIRIPILIAQGAHDPRVKKEESEQIVNAMREKGLDCEYLLFMDEGHGFTKPANRLKFFEIAEKFLAKHLGGRYESSN